MGEVVNRRVAIESCYPHPDNYNYHSPEQIADLRTSLKTFGQVRSIVVQDDGQGAYLLVAGHGIHEAAKAEGYDELRADVIPPDWSAVRVKAYLAADNELAKGATPDEAQLAALVVDVGEVDETLARLAAGTDERLRELVALAGNGKGPVEVPEPAIDKAEELQQTWQVKNGDIWEVGRHRIICGDCTDGVVVEKATDKESLDLLFIDPPYGVKRDKGFEGFGGFGPPIARRQYEDDWDSERPTREVLDTLRATAQNALIFGGNFLADILPKSTHWVVWDKLNTMPTYGDCELIWTNFARLSVKKITFEYNGLIGKEAQRFHPTQKPLGLYELLLQEYSKEDATVIDFYSGSGTTLVACERLGRLGRGVEIEPKYVAVTLERLAGMGLQPQRVSQLTEAV